MTKQPQAVRYEVRSAEGIILDVADEAQDALEYLDLHRLSGSARVWAVLDDGSEGRLPA